MNDRLLYNRAIIDKISELVDKNPQLRFNQILHIAGIIEGKNGIILDKFYEESKDTWVKMTQNQFCFPNREK